jgi:fatty-acyl-CoA synthase/long-chain acyl-CoA synthetase
VAADAPAVPAVNPWVEVSPLGDLLVIAASRRAERDAIVLPDQRRTYGALLDGARHVARGLFALGVRPRDHVGVLLPNSVEFCEALLGIALLGAVAVPLNTRYKSDELGYVVDHSEMTCLLTGDHIDAHVGLTSTLAASFPSLDAAADPTHLRLAEAEKLHSIVLLRGGDRAGFVDRARFDALAAAADHALVDGLRDRVRLRDPAMIVYTSGTTSRPKGCILSHEALTRSGLARAHERLEPAEHDVYWSGGPLFHIGSLAPFLACVGVAGTYLCDVHFQAQRALALMEQEGVTSAWPLFPAIMTALTAADTFDPQALRTLNTIVLIGPPVLLRETQSLLPWARLLNACGMTETSAMYALNPYDDTVEQRAATGGTLLRGLEARIVDPETGVDLPAGEVGEILVRGYSVMNGYFRDPDKTAEALDPDGWLHTQDLYVADETGHLTFQGRLKDMLKVGGENVAAVEVEAFLCRHPAVRLAEVVAGPDPRLEEVPIAFVELHAGERVDEQELIAFCQGQIASFKIPRAIHFVEPNEWPMSTNKVDKNVLRRWVLDPKRRVAK